MSRTTLAALVAAGAVLLGAAPASAEVQVMGVSWELAGQKGQPAKALDGALKLAPGAPLPGRLHAKVKLLNRGEAAAQGVLLRYTVCARLTREGSAEESKSVWSLPFTSDEEHRVAKIGGNKTVETNLDPTSLLDLYLKRVHREGLWPVELKAQVMLEPRAKSEGLPKIVEAALPIAHP